MAYLRGTTVPPTAPPAYEPRRRVQHFFHGWDGSVWDLSHGINGVYLMSEGVEGLGMPEIDNFTLTSPLVHGVEWEGWRASGRETFFTIGIFDDNSDHWLATKAAFWNIFRPGKTMRWEVVLPNNERYFLTVRFKTDNSSNYSRDPVQLGWAIYGITCFTEQPFWEGLPQTYTWYPPNTQDFIPSGGATPLYISSFSDIGNAWVNNPGDVPASLLWTLKGPFTSAVVGFTDEYTTVGATNSGSTVVLDMNPIRLTATRDGVDIMASLGYFDYAMLPPGENIRLNLAMTGTGSISATFTPLYLRSI